LAEAVQLVVICVHDAPEPAFDVGAAGVAGNVAYVIMPEFAEVPQLLTALTLK